MLGDDLNGVALTPHLQLFNRRGAEGIAGGEQHRLALTLQALGQFANGSGLAGAVDADHQDHIRLARRVDRQRLAHRLKDRPHVLAQGAHQRLTVAELLARDALAQTADNTLGRLDPDIGHQQLGLQLLEQIIIDATPGLDQVAQVGVEYRAGARQAALEAVEQAALLRCLLFNHRGFIFTFSETKHICNFTG